MEKRVVCGYCEHYLWFSCDKKNQIAVCEVKGRVVSGYSEVCEEFIIHRGVHTTRKIPDYCKRYNND